MLFKKFEIKISIYRKNNLHKHMLHFFYHLFCYKCDKFAVYTIQFYCARNNLADAARVRDRLCKDDDGGESISATTKRLQGGFVRARAIIRRGWKIEFIIIQNMMLSCPVSWNNNKLRR